VTIRIALVGPDGEPTGERTFEQRPYVSVGGGAADEYRVAGLPEGAIYVSEDASGAYVASGPKRIPLPVGEPRVIDLGLCKLQIGVFGKTRPGLGACPRCGAAVSERASGGAYRSMVSRERACVACGTAVLELGAAARSIGAFSERPDTEWVTVTVPMDCPQCGNPLTRTSLRTAYGQAEVERCAPCELIVLEQKDRAVLGG